MELTESYDSIIGRNNLIEREMIYLGGQSQDLLNQLLRIGWTLQEQFDDGGQQLKLHLRTLILQTSAK